MEEGELAYWLELKTVFDAVKVPYPMLVMRNSFLLKDDKAQVLQQKLQLTDEELFMQYQNALNLITQRNTHARLDTKDEQQQTYKLYEKLQELALEIDVTLKPHIAALHIKTLQGLKALETKLLKAEREKQTDKAGQLQQLRHHLFPNGNLQERVDNFMPLYAKYGSGLIDKLYGYSLGLEQQFGILNINKT